jgi:soluble lytic murein transglycosylase-like protein
VLAVIETESQFRPGIKSPVGATGLMQVKPSTFKEQYNRANKPTGKIKDPAANILGGMLYLRELKAKYKTWEKALEAYNIGPTAVAKGERNLNYVYKVMSRKGKYEEGD